MANIVNFVGDWEWENKIKPQKYILSLLKVVLINGWIDSQGKLWLLGH